ncbi:MAG: molybdopterin binding domain [Hyphomicrobiales bacterium]|nr:molybdopterin binding domain [Hyphomicrobiales bacterium]
MPVADSAGAIVAHSVRLEGLVLKKGDQVRSEHVALLQEAGVREIVVARLEDGDVGEDEAAGLLARAVCGANVRVEAPFTGRSNLFAQSAGVLVAERACVDRINEVDETITLATLPPWRVVEAGEMIGTVKIIPFAAPRAALDAAIAAATPPCVSVAPFRPMRLGIVSTLLPGLKPATVAKTLRVMGERLAPMGSRIVAEVRTAHEADPLADAIATLAPACDMVVVFGASAITDRRDVIPAALLKAGGEIVHLGMPVDPGNLLLVGKLHGKPVLGAPGCARSPKENGFDWVLQRLLAGVDVTAADIRRMGAGGLLMEIVQRGQPREGADG